MQNRGSNAEWIIAPGSRKQFSSIRGAEIHPTESKIDKNSVECVCVSSFVSI